MTCSTQQFTTKNGWEKIVPVSDRIRREGGVGGRDGGMERWWDGGMEGGWDVKRGGHQHTCLRSHASYLVIGSEDGEASTGPDGESRRKRARTKAKRKQSKNKTRCR